MILYILYLEYRTGNPYLLGTYDNTRLFTQEQKEQIERNIKRVPQGSIDEHPNRFVAMFLNSDEFMDLRGLALTETDYLYNTRFVGTSKELIEFLEKC